jgi:hypothetical protein
VAVADSDPVVVTISPLIVPLGVPVDKPETDDVVVIMSSTFEAEPEADGLGFPFFATSTSPLTHSHCPRFALQTSVAHPAYPHVNTFVEELGHE